MFCRFKFSALYSRPFHLYFHHYPTTGTAQSKSQSQTPILTDLLVNRLGFSREEALSATRKVDKSTFTENDPHLVVNFFEKLGLSKTQIKSIVSAHPRLLSYHVDKTLHPKINALQEIGISGKDLMKFLLKDKYFLSRGLENQIKPSIEYLRNALGSDVNVAQAVRKYNAFFQFYKPDAVAKKVEFLEKMGFPTDCVPRFLLRNPRCLISRNEWLEKIFHRVEKDFGISPGSKMFYHTFLAVGSLDNSMKAKFELFRSFGWSDATIYQMVRKSPSVLCISEEKLRKSWEFWVGELGYEPDYFVKHPIILSLSLDKRVKPRHEVFKILNEKKLFKRNLGLYTFMCRSELKFINGYLLPYKDVIPDVYSSYLKVVGWTSKDGKPLV